jgi:hypothetical protein
MSAQVLIPVLKRMGFPVAIIASSNSLERNSPDPTFHAAIPSRASRSTAASEKAELRKISFFSFA